METSTDIDSMGTGALPRYLLRVRGRGVVDVWNIFTVNKGRCCCCCVDDGWDGEADEDEEERSICISVPFSWPGRGRNIYYVVVMARDVFAQVLSVT
jgi:hypothetical protein